MTSFGRFSWGRLLISCLVAYLPAIGKNTISIIEKILFNLNTPIATKVVCISRLLKCLKSLYGKQCGPRSDCSYRSSLFWVHAVCFYTSFSVMLGNYLQQTTSADDIFRCIFSWRFKGKTLYLQVPSADNFSKQFGPRSGQTKWKKHKTQISITEKIPLALNRLVSSADNFCKQFGPRSGRTKRKKHKT